MFRLESVSAITGISLSEKTFSDSTNVLQKHQVLILKNIQLQKVFGFNNCGKYIYAISETR